MLNRAVALIAALAVAPLVFVGGSSQAAPKRDWSAQVSATAAGAYVVGNPAAKVKLVEFLSYTCNHCAAFARASDGPLHDGAIKSGQVSVEVRHAVRDRYDLTAALLARCGGPARFTANHRALYANFDAWIPRIVAYDAANPPRPGNEPVATMTDIADKTGLFALLASKGLPLATQRACIADAVQQKVVTAMARDAWEVRKIGGTPSFLINGAPAPQANDWPGVVAALREAGAALPAS